MKASRFLTVIASVAICVSLFGPTITQANPIDVTFAGVPGGVIRTLSIGNVYMGPYALQVSGASPSLWMCFDAGVHVANQWSALNTNTAGAVGYYGEFKVDEVTWLANLWGGTVTAPGTYDLADINSAIWNVMNNVQDPANSAKVDPLVVLAKAYATANTDLLTANFLIPGDLVNGQWKFNAAASQPFVQPVPEPGTLLLLGTGLIGAAGFSRRFFRRK